jgi:hypothetical protein
MLDPKAPQELLNKSMNTVVGFKRRKMLLKLKYTNCS